MESSERSYDEKRAYLDALITRCDERLLHMQPGIVQLIDARHAVSEQATSLFEVAHPTIEQIYEDPGYNDTFTYGEDADGNGGDLDTRHGKGFGEGETFNEGEYADLILAVAADHGIIRPEVLSATDPLDQRIGIADSNLEPVGGVDAVVVPAAAGISNIIRVRDAIRNIESGNVNTDRLIIATCERTVKEAEAQRLHAKGFEAGETESGSVRLALEELLGTSLGGGETRHFPVRFKNGQYDAWVYSKMVMIGGKEIECMIVSTEYDTKRMKARNQAADRADTYETFVAVNELLNEGKGRILVDSHDTWSAGQGVIAEQVFGIAGKEVITTGPQKLDRVVRNEKGKLVLTAPEAVVDEIAKNYAFLVQTRIMALNERERLNREEAALAAAFELGVDAESITRELSRAIPEMDELRERKQQGYKDIPIDASDEFFTEPPVQLKAFDIAGQNYYSRPNATVDEPIEGVETYPRLRKSVAVSFATLNLLIAHPAITKFFGGEVELYVEDGLRTPETQDQLFTEAVPNLIRRNHPEYTDAAMSERRKDIIAPASFDDSKPSPHSTGGAADVILRFRQPQTPLFVANRNVWIGHTDGDTTKSIDPDYFEAHGEDELAKRNRRAFYSIMTGAAFGVPTDLAVNPTEIWHWSRGDQLWAMVTGAPRAYYGPVKGD